MKIQLQDIAINGGTQGRELINDNLVQEYTEYLLEGHKFPEAEVFFDGKTYWLVDGFHRYFAHKRAKINEIDCKVIKGTQREAQRYSWGVNANHGAPRTTADKRKIIRSILDDFEFSSLSSREIAKEAKMSHTFVIKMQKLIEQEKHMKVATPIPRPEKDIPEVTTFKPLPEVAPEPYDPVEDEIKHLANVNQELHEENLKLQNNMIVLSDDQKSVADALNEKDKKIKALEAELQSTRNSRDQFQAKAAELVKQVAYYKKQLEKFKKQ